MRVHPDRRRVAAAVGVVLLLLVALAIVVGRRDDQDAGPAPATTTRPPAGPGTPVPPAGTGTSEPEPPAEVGPAQPPTEGGSPPAPPTTAAPAPAGAGARLGRVRTWSFALGAAVSDRSGASVAPQFKGYDLVVLDGVDASANVVSAVRAQGSLVLAYANVGAIEKGRPWTSAAQPYKLDYWEDWDEWYADVAKPGFRSLVTSTIVPPMLAKGFDGVFLDNVDMVDTHPAQRQAMIGLVAQLSATVRGRGGLLFAQNGEDGTVNALAPYLDGWNREDVSYTHGDGGYEPVPAGDRQAALATVRRMRARGTFVTTIDYLPGPDGPDAQSALRAACSAGAVPTIGDINLTRVYRPYRC